MFGLVLRLISGGLLLWVFGFWVFPFWRCVALSFGWLRFAWVWCLVLLHRFGIWFSVLVGLYGLVLI